MAISLPTYELGILVALWVLYKFLRPSQLSAIPTVGYGGPILSFITGFKWLGNAQELCREGYEKHYGKVFKIATPASWAIILSGPELINDFRRAVDDEVSFELLQIAHTIHPDVAPYPSHVGVVRSPLTRNLAEYYDDVHAEIVDSIADLIPKSENWVKVHALTTIEKTIARASNRMLTGAPSIYRDEDYLRLCIDFALDVFATAQVVDLFPDIMKGFAKRFMNKVPARHQQAMRHLGPLVAERLQNELEHGSDWPGKPNDAISWLIDEALPERRTVEEITLRLMVLNFASIHPISMATATTLYYIAAHPKVASVLYEEAQEVIGHEGWSKASLDKLVKMDSVIKEAMRCDGVSVLSSGRQSMREYTFSDGTTIPAGIVVYIAAEATQHDERLYRNATEFEPYRFDKLRNETGSNIYAMNAVHQDYMVFGQGRHACPGRYLAVAEIKTILAELILNYELKFEDEGKIPPFVHLGPVISPNPEAEILYRARKG